MNNIEAIETQPSKIAMEMIAFSVFAVSLIFFQSMELCHLVRMFFKFNGCYV